VRLAPALCVAVLLACGGEPDAPAPRPVPVPDPPKPVPTPPTPEPVPEGLRGDADEGAILYGQFCAVCHGKTGKGDGPTAGGLNPKPADHTDAAYMGALSDEHLYTVIQKGGAAVGKSPLMTPWGGVLTDAQIRDLVAFLRRISGTP
jgi:mono/diheme cytochrome c family protein